MKVNYTIQLDHIHQHLVRVKMHITELTPHKQIRLFLPRWSPGSYLIREYVRHLQNLTATNEQGEMIEILTPKMSEFILTPTGTTLLMQYNVYARDWSVRTPHVDATHAFLHLPALLLGMDAALEQPTLKIEGHSFERLTTGLAFDENKDCYTAANYDELIDSPIEVGCHTSHFFSVKGIHHEVAFYGPTSMLPKTLLADIKKIVEGLIDLMGGDIPYERYAFTKVL